MKKFVLLFLSSVRSVLLLIISVCFLFQTASLGSPTLDPLPAQEQIKNRSFSPTPLQQR